MVGYGLPFSLSLIHRYNYQLTEMDALFAALRQRYPQGVISSMQKVLSSDLWKTVRAQAQKSRCRKAAIAYVTKDLIQFRKGDLLVMDASPQAISCGETDAKLLRTLDKKGVSLYHCAGLHAKVLLLDDVAVISSGNLSNSSANGLVEAGMITDHGSTVAGVASFIEQVLAQSRELEANRIATLCKIKVVRRGGRGTGSSKQRRPKVAPLGSRTWLLGVRELVKEATPDEQRLIDRAMEKLRTQMKDPEEESAWLRWASTSRFARECRQGDSVIQIWNSSKAKRPKSVFRSASVLLKRKSKKWTWLFLKEPTGSQAEMSWGKFKGLLKEVGYSRHVGPWILHVLDPDVADAITRRWKSAAKS